MPSRRAAVLTMFEIAVRREETVFTILAGISACHLLNDLIQATIPSLYLRFLRVFGLSLGRDRLGHRQIDSTPGQTQMP